MRFRIIGGAMALVLLGTAPLAGQRGPRGMPGPGPRPGATEALEERVEAALRHGEALELDEVQIADLEALRLDVESTLGPLRDEMDALRSEARDRSGSREEVRERMRALRERGLALRARADTLTSPLQARFEQIVPPLQRQTLDRTVQADRRRQGVGRRGSAEAARSHRRPRGERPRADARRGGGLGGGLGDSAWRRHGPGWGPGGACDLRVRPSRGSGWAR